MPLFHSNSSRQVDLPAGLPPSRSRWRFFLLAAPARVCPARHLGGALFRPPLNPAAGASFSGRRSEIEGSGEHRTGFLASGMEKSTMMRVKRKLVKLKGPISEVSDEGIWGPSPGSDVHPRRLKNIGDVYTNSRAQDKLDTKLFQAYVEHLWVETSSKKTAKCTYVDCLWFKMFLKGACKRVMSWLKQKNLFSMTYTFIPIVCWDHWNLLILCNFDKKIGDTTGPCMLLVDSLLNADPMRVEPDIRRFVLEIFHTEGRTETDTEICSIPLLFPKVPQQRNGSECGVFALYYMYLFLQELPMSFTLDGYPYFLSESWFTYEDVDAFEQKVRSFSRGDSEEKDGGQQAGIPVEGQPATSRGELDNGGKDDNGNEAIAARRKRGGTLCRDVHGMEDGNLICVEWNDLGQPVGPGGRSLRTFLGTLARNTNKLPIIYPNWKKVPNSNKADAWDYIKRKYDIDEMRRMWVLKDVSQKWKYFKYTLRKRYFNPKLRASQQKHPDAKLINLEQWKEAVKLWCAKDWLEKSQVNKGCKGKQKWFHCAGTRTVADIRKLEYEKNGASLDRSDLFILTHVRKDGKPVNDECAAVIEKLMDLKQSQAPICSTSSHPVAMQNDVYAQVLGEDRSGRVRGLGTGPTPSTLWGTCRNLQTENNILIARVKELEERVIKVEQPAVQGANGGLQRGSESVFSSSVASIHGETIERAKTPDLQNPPQTEVYMVTHTRKGGRPIDEASAPVMAKLSEQVSEQEASGCNTPTDAILTQILGEDRHGCGRTFGLGPSPSDDYGLKPTRTQALQLVNEIKKTAEEKLIKMREQMEAMKAEQEGMKAEQEEMKQKYEDRLAELQTQLQDVVLLVRGSSMNFQAIEQFSLQQYLLSPASSHLLQPPKGTPTLIGSSFPNILRRRKVTGDIPLQ